MSEKAPYTPEEPYVPNTIVDSIDEQLDTIFDEGIKENYSSGSINTDQIAVLEKKQIELMYAMFDVPSTDIGDPDLNDALSYVSKRLDNLKAHLASREE
jgi:hypothetical protein